MSIVDGAGARVDPAAGARAAWCRGTPPRSAHGRIGLEHAALAAILLLSGLLEFVRLSQNGYANTYYSAAVKSMLRSWSNFFFVSADPNGLITVDKPPLGLWLQGLSAKLFGFAPLSLLIPEGICAVLAVALLYRIVAPRFGSVAGLLSAFALAVFPSFVAVSRDNGVDPLLVLLMLASVRRRSCRNRLGPPADAPVVRRAGRAGVQHEVAGGAALHPGDRGRLSRLRPGLAAAAPRAALAAGVVFLLVAASWSIVVDLTPASQRPYVGGSLTNSEFQLEFGYNGFGRVGGQQGGPGTTTLSLSRAQLAPLVRPGVTSPQSPAERRYFATHPRSHRRATPSPRVHARGRHRRTVPIPFGGTRSPLRIFGTGLGDQAGWLVPLALIGMIALALVVRGRDDRRTAGVYVLGGWMLVELLTLDFSSRDRASPTTPRRSAPGSPRWPAPAPSRSARWCAAPSREGR